jgi:hypothetical protein
MKNYKTALLYLFIMFSEFGILGLSRLHVSAGPHLVEMISPYKWLKIRAVYCTGSTCFCEQGFLNASGQ